MFVSIDGAKGINDKYRGDGNYQEVLENFSNIKNDFFGKSIASMTITSDNNIYDSVLEIVDKFDFIYWKMISDDKLENKEKFKDIYVNGISNLADY